MNRTVTVADWHELVKQGTVLPMHIPINGISMNPLIRRNRDYVTIEPMEGIPEIGDIVLFADPYSDLYVLHRVWKLDGDRVLTWGDNCENPDRWMTLDAVWGKAVLIERGRWKIHPKARRGIKWAKFWHPAGKAYRRGKNIMYAVGHRIKRLWKKDVR